MKDMALIIDYKYCTGCHTCEIACRNEKGIPLDEWGIKLTELGPKKLGGKWMWDYVPIPSDLCDLCAERVEEGLRPACAHHCLGQCMYIVPSSEAERKMDELGGKKVVCFRP